jgi:deazaflavin-dependent oxidoreductase (nitroreductase family)
MDERAAMQRSRQVGVGSLVIGGALLRWPRVGRVAGLDARATRLIAFGDLAVGPGLIWGRPRRPWLFARAVVNVGIAGLLLLRRSRTGLAIAAGLGAATAADLQMAGALSGRARAEDASAASPSDLLRDGAEAPSLNGRLNLAAAEVLNDRGIYLGRRSTKVHVALYRRSGGRLGRKVPGFPGAEIALIDHLGAKSGTSRTSPLMCLRDGEAIAVVASKAGQPTNPAWFHNLMANPATTVQVGGEVRSVRARLADEEERERLYARFVAAYPAYASYRERAHPRVIPIVILEPRAAAD